MNMKFLESRIEKTTEDIKYKNKQLVNRKAKVDALESSKKILKEVYEEELSWVVWLEKTINEEQMMLEIFYTARDLKA
jgi:vacuolar-type H+-ATPase subunit E/Vma4